jgi:hypothetical protein
MAEPKDAGDDPHFSLADWRRMINRLIREHGADTIMYTDGGYNNVTLRLVRPGTIKTVLKKRNQQKVRKPRSR